MAKRHRVSKHSGKAHMKKAKGGKKRHPSKKGLIKA
jgi:hypothetical protein